ncbi:MAG TPA: hypothetical protein PLU22_25310, partial [Polyangiaceae bacterium]|nr:hypothetical protein [Polyangiaceae bacterium]
LATSPWLELARELALTPVLVLPAAIAAGALLPAAGAALARGRVDPGRRVGAVVLANGVGATLGAVSASWVLGQRVAIHDGFRLLASLGVAGGAAVALLAGRGRARALGVVAPWVRSPRRSSACPPRSHGGCCSRRSARDTRRYCTTRRDEPPRFRSSRTSSTARDSSSSTP